MHILKLHSFPIEQVADLERLERALGDWFAGIAFPVRLLAISRRFDMRPPIDDIRREQGDLERLRRAVTPLLHAIDRLPDSDPAQVVQSLPPATSALLLDLLADAPALQQALVLAEREPDDAASGVWHGVADMLDTLLWRLPWMQEMTRFYDALQQRHLRATEYLLLAWTPPEVSAAALAATLRHATGRAVEVVDRLPGVLTGVYVEQMTRLKPDQPGLPWLACLLSYEARGAWDATTLHGLLAAPYDVALAIDIHTMSRNQGMRAAEMAYNAARVVARDQQVVDMRAARVVAAAERVMHELAQQSLHTVQIGVLVGGSTEEELETNVAETSARLGAQLRLLRPAGAQGEALKLWSPAPRTQIDAPFAPRTVLSHGVGCCMGVLGYHQAHATAGLFWGMDAVRRSPLFFDLFAGNQAAHMVILGKSGFGKTYFLNLLALRGAALAGYRVIGIDAFRNGDRIAAAVRAGATCAALGLETAINILDVVIVDDDGSGGWIAGQVQHVIGQLALLLGSPSRSGAGKEQYIPRSFSIAERGVLDRALRALYAGVNPQCSRAEMPILSDLVAELERVVTPEARALARELRMLLYGSDDPSETTLTVLGRSFNAPTMLDWQFGNDINYFDVSRVPELLRPFYYIQVIGAILRSMRDPARDRSRPTLLQIDEFGYLTQVEALAHLAATICKVARKYGIGLVAIDQNPATFLESEHGRFIIENAVAKVLFHLDDLPARQMGAAITDLTPAHVDFLSHAGVGEALAVVGNDVYVMAVESNPKELRALRGS